MVALPTAASVSLDAGTISAIFIGAASLVGWLVTQAQARSRANRRELRWRRRQDGLKDRYVARLEYALNTRDIELPEKPEGLDEDDSEDTW